MEVGADEGQQRDLTTDVQPTDQPAAEQNAPAADQEAPSPGTTNTETPTQPEPAAADPGTVTLADIHNDMQHAIMIDYWLLGALMVIAGFLVVITFFTARGESSG